MPTPAASFFRGAKDQNGSRVKRRHATTAQACFSFGGRRVQRERSAASRAAVTWFSIVEFMQTLLYAKSYPQRASDRPGGYSGLRSRTRPPGAVRRVSPLRGSGRKSSSNSIVPLHMTNSISLLNLPFEIIFALGAGFAGYATCFPAERQRHKASEITLLTLLFGILALTSYRVSQNWFAFDAKYSQMIVPPIFGIIISVFVGLIWRRFFRQTWLDFLRITRISHLDEVPGAWEKIISDPRCEITQINVRMKSGRVLFCTDASRFSDAPFGPCYFGFDGSVAFYPTHIKNPSNDDFEQTEDSRNPEFGDIVTYVPASEIAEVNLRWKRK